MNKTWIVSGVLALAGAIGLVGCAVEAPDSEFGTLEMAVRATGSSGTEYGLAATFSLTGPEATLLTSTALDTAGIINASPRVGSYQLQLCALNGGGGCPAGATWTLNTITCAGGLPVAGCPQASLVATPIMGATLVGFATRTITIKANQTTSVIYEFQVPGTGNIVFATGKLDVDVTVTEGFANGTACTTALQCQSKVCTAGVCVAATCTDGVQNGTETAPDCGGTCGACPTACMSNPDCAYNTVCINGLCLAGTAVACTTATVVAACGPGRTCNTSAVNTNTCAGLSCSVAVGCPAGFVCTSQPGGAGQFCD